MTTALVVAFLAAHGLVHLAIWLPHPEPDPERPPPFEPDHSALLTATAAPVAAVHRIAVACAVAVAAGYVLAAVAIARRCSRRCHGDRRGRCPGARSEGALLPPVAELRGRHRPGLLAGALTGWPVSL